MADLVNPSEKCPICPRYSKTEGLCQQCEARIHTQLDDLLEFWDLAHGELLPGKSGGGGRSSERTIGLNVNALSWVQGADILGMLHEWEKFVRGALSLTPPAMVQKEKTLALEIATTIKFMQTHLRFLAATDYIEDFNQELKELHALGMNACKKFTEKATRIACPADNADGLPCGWMLRISEEQKADPLTIFTCRACNSQWTLLRLMAVAINTTGQKVWLDVEAIAIQLGMTEKNVHQFARRHKFKMRGEQYDLIPFIEARKLEI